MKYRITDLELPGEELIVEGEPDEFAPEDGQVTAEVADEIIDWWASSSQVGGRSSYDPEDHGIRVLAEVHRTGEDIEMAAWFEVDRDGYFPLSGFPFDSLEFEELAETKGD